MQVADTGFHPKGQCLYDVIPVLDTGIQKKEWCHSSVPMMSSQWPL
ncbi:hypothetical protein [Wolbachia endosymbiont (group A) of Anomoia purmunda]|nr:hypothetical protein [Wolbachia endosymbiont (group A) of Anomoia purmunda]